MCRFFLASTLLLTLAACSDSGPKKGALKLTVSYEGFVPGCVRVVAQDATGKAPKSTELSGKGQAPAGGKVTLAVLPESSWGTSVEVLTEAFERNCTGNPVARQSQALTLASDKVTELQITFHARDADADGYVSNTEGGTDCDDAQAAMNPGQVEVCDTLDNDCDNQDDEDFEVGAVCNTTDECQGAWACDGLGARTCTLAPNRWKTDADGDGRGSALEAGTSECKQPPGKVPNSLDCDDTDNTRYTGAVELCDTKDNDCDGVEDEGLGLGGSCREVGQCTGVRACGAQGAVVCNGPVVGASCPGQGDCAAGVVSCSSDGTARCSAPTPVTYYPDGDLDTYGSPSGSVSTCNPAPAGMVTRAGDCDDGNPFVRVGAAELCDTLDNDCDSSFDEGGVCGSANATWVEQVLPSSGGAEWRTVSVWGEGGLWIAGLNSRLRFKAPGSTSFSNFDDRCPGNWHSLWVQPSNGRAHLAGEARKLAIHDLAAPTCTSVSNLASALTTRGLWGLSSEMGLRIHGVGITPTTPLLGESFVWNGGTEGATPVTDDDAVAPLLDVHGLSEQVLFASGGYEAGSSNFATPRIYRYRPSTGTWATEYVQLLFPTENDKPSENHGPLRGIWVVHAHLAYAVGDYGTVLVWNGSTWAIHPSPGNVNLTSVIAFGRSSVYATAANGRVYGYNGSTWQSLELSTTPLYDIAGTSPADLWVVGANGKVLHWPR